MMTKLYVIDTAETEYHIYALDIDDALNTFDGRSDDIICIKEYENYSQNDTLH